MSTHNNFDYINHMLDSIRKVKEFIAKMTFEEFSKNEMAQSAVAREFTVIGEAANSMDSSFKEKYSNIPWHLAVGMRNQLIHEYFDVDLKIVWNTVKQDLPNLQRKLTKIIK